MRSLGSRSSKRHSSSVRDMAMLCNQASIHICTCTQTPFSHVRTLCAGLWIVFAAASDGTFCKDFRACISRYPSCLTLKTPCLLKYKQIQADIVSNHQSIKHTLSNCYVWCQESYTGKYKENTFSDLKV